MSLIEDIDYIDADVAYLLGLITARGKISEDSDVRLYHSEDGKLPRQLIIAEWEMATCRLNRHTMIGGTGL